MREARRAAFRIFRDLKIQRGKVSLSVAIELCEAHGGEPIAVPVPGRFGCCIDGAILVSVNGSEDETATVIIHELAHRLSMASEAYSEHNRPWFRRFDYRQFQELVAREVERLWVKAGGTDARKRH